VTIAAHGPVDQRPVPSAGRRIAAATALVSLTAAVVIVVVFFLRDPVRLVAALLVVPVAVMAGWTLLVHRGVRRLLASLATVAALVALVALLAAESLLRLAAVVALVVLATALGRVAFGQDFADAPAGVRPVGPARHGVLLMNPRSGGGKVERFRLEDEARHRGVMPVVLHPGDDLRELAEEAVAQGADVVGMAGGDGSQALVADVARRHDVAFVVVPAGTRNHFALDLGLDRNDVASAIDAFGTAIERRVDLAMLGDRVFVNNASLGVYATVVQSEGYREAKLATTARLMPELLGPGAAPPDLRFPGPDGTQVAPANLVLVSNGVYRLDSLNGFGTRPRLDTGVLGVVTVTIDRARDMAELMAAEATRRLHNFRGYRHWTTSELDIDSEQPLVDVGMDGEALRLPPPLHFRSLPGALRVRIPPHSPGAAPAAVAPAGPGETISGLLRVLTGRPARRPNFTRYGRGAHRTKP
jgi:diacylglycerol kinase family enzyme